MASLTNDSDMYGDDEIFFGSVPVYFKKVPGKAVAYVHDDYHPDTVRDEQGMPTNTLARKDAIPHPDGGPSVVVPCMPCLDAVADKVTMDVSKWPEYLQTPLIKCPAPTSADQPKAFASGQRSACVKVENKWYRLKGSGNNDEGFTVKTQSQIVEVGKPKVETRQIRGAAFIHTAICENFYSSELPKQMDQHNTYGTNGSMGYYTYEGADELPLGLSNKEFQPACIVETTRGDRRMGTHVIAGLTLLLPQLLDETKLNEDLLIDLFPDERKEGGQVPFADWPFFSEKDALPIMKTGALFGHAGLKCGQLFMTRPASGEKRDEAWATLKADIAKILARGGEPADQAAAAAAAAAEAEEKIVGSTTAPVTGASLEELQNMCKHICTSRLVGTVDNVAALVIGDDKSSGAFDSWIYGDYKGDTNFSTPTWSMLQLWYENDGPITGPLKNIQEQLPVVSRQLLARDADEHFAAAAISPSGDTLPKQFWNNKSTHEEGEKDADPKWTKAWKDTCDMLQQYVESDKKQSVLMYVYSRLGYECGKIARLLHFKCNTSWGTYQDKLCHESQWHCNAHANNIAIMAPGNSDDTYLSYLDFDMAFDATTVVDVNPSSDTYGRVGQTDEDFGLLLAFEHFNFMEVVAGNDSSTGVPQIAQKSVSNLSKKHQLANEVLSDTMMNGYLYAYYDEELEGVSSTAGGGEMKSSAGEASQYSVAPFDKELHEVGMALIKLAIIKQADYLA